eukprot:scaffold541909_cov30-Prasinocladus_malaysianus.AAC.1
MSLAIEELEAELGPLRGAADSSRAKAEVAALEEQLASASARRSQLQAKLDAQDFLTPEDDGVLRELDDAADTVDAELEYLAEASTAAAAAVAEGAEAAQAFARRTRELGLNDARGLLGHYMETLVAGRDRERLNAAKVAGLE